MFFSHTEKQSQNQQNHHSLFHNTYGHRANYHLKMTRKRRQVAIDLALCLAFVCWYKPLTNLTPKDSFFWHKHICSGSRTITTEVCFIHVDTQHHILAQSCLALPPQCSSQETMVACLEYRKHSYAPVSSYPVWHHNFTHQLSKSTRHFAHFWQVTSQWLAMQRFLLTKTGVPTSEKSLKALEGGLEYKPVLPLQGQEHTTCTSCAFASCGKTASAKITAVYSNNLTKTKFDYRSWAQFALQMRPETCVLVRTTKQARDRI